MAKEFTITRQEVVNAATSLLGVRFRHQGRSAETGVDCVGFVIEIGRILKYPFKIFDRATYRRMPSEKLALEYLRLNMEEIPLKKAGIGDLVSMVQGGHEVHVGVLVSDKRLIHAKRSSAFKGSVQADYIKDWQHTFRRGFRIKGLID